MSTTRRITYQRAFRKVQTGGGSTAGVQHPGLIGAGAGLVLAAAIIAVFGYRRRYTF